MPRGKIKYKRTLDNVQKQKKIGRKRIYTFCIYGWARFKNGVNRRGRERESVFILPKKRGNQADVPTYQLFTKILTYLANQKSCWTYMTTMWIMFSVSHKKNKS